MIHAGQVTVNIESDIPTKIKHSLSGENGLFDAFLVTKSDHTFLAKLIFAARPANPGIVHRLIRQAVK